MQNYKLKTILLLVLFLGLFGLAQSSEAKVINVVNTFGQPSCEAVDVQRVINSASDGDTVFVPAGSCTWDAQVDMNKAITLQGAGVDKTIITDATTSSGRALKVNLASGDVKITGFTFKAVTDWGDSMGLVEIGGGTQTFRFHHNKFDMTGTANSGHALRIAVGDSPTYGVINHNQFINLQKLQHGIFVQADDELGWDKPLSFGTDDAVYIEDNDFTGLCLTIPCYANGVEHNSAARSVIRKNTFTNAGIQAHGSCSSPYGYSVFSMEIYNNTFTITSGKAQDRSAAIRGGTGLIFNNTFTGTINNLASIYYERACGTEDFGCSGGVSWTRCNGQSYARLDQTLSDGNQAEPNGTGTHNGSDNASILTDSGKSWTPSAFVGIYVYNQTDGSNCQITANTATTVTCTLSGGTDNDWDSGDTYKISGGYPCVQQIGRTTSLASAPYYLWGNLKNGATDGMSISTSCSSPPYMSNKLQENRDFYNNGLSGTTLPSSCTVGTSYWKIDEGEWDSTNGATPDGRFYRCTATDTWELAYTPYTYPHPLTLGDDYTPPSAPTGLVIE